VICQGVFGVAVIEFDRQRADSFGNEGYGTGHSKDAHGVAGTDRKAGCGRDSAKQGQRVRVRQGQRLLLSAESKCIFDLLKGHVIRCEFDMWQKYHTLIRGGSRKLHMQLNREHSQF